MLILLPVLASPYPGSNQCRSTAEMPYWRRSTSNIQPYRSQPHNSARRRLLRFRIFRMAWRPKHFRSRSHKRNRTCQIKLRPWHKRQRKTDRPDIFHIHSMGGFHRNTSCRRLSSGRFNPADSCRQTDRQRRAQNDDSRNRSKPWPCRRPPHRTIFQSAVNLLSRADISQWYGPFCCFSYGYAHVVHLKNCNLILITLNLIIGNFRKEKQQAYWIWNYKLYFCSWNNTITTSNW